MTFIQPDTRYIKRARILAIAWTLLVFIGCLMPGKEIPDVNVPFADKWVHFLLFGGFCFLWLCTYPAAGIKAFIILFFTTALLGYFIEVLQYLLTFLGRSYDLVDALADAVGGLLGIPVFIIYRSITNKLQRN